MSTDTPKYPDEIEREARHSALAEFSRDERRPAVLLLGGLVIAAIFFALGIMVGRWTRERGATPAAPASPQQHGIPASTPTPSPSPTPSSSPTPLPSATRPSASPARNR